MTTLTAFLGLGGFVGSFVPTRSLSFPSLEGSPVFAGMDSTTMLEVAVRSSPLPDIPAPQWVGTERGLY
jgi:hypothetical protein